MPLPAIVTTKVFPGAGGSAEDNQEGHFFQPLRWVNGDNSIAITVATDAKAEVAKVYNPESMTMKMHVEQGQDRLHSEGEKDASPCGKMTQSDLSFLGPNISTIRTHRVSRTGRH